VRALQGVHRQAGDRVNARRPQYRRTPPLGYHHGMADVFTREQRSAVMRRVRSADTKPELRVRRLAHRLGYRFRLHRKDLPGRPDLVFPARRVVLLVHGCYWHRHPHCEAASSPTTPVQYWQAKFARNVARDAAVTEALTRLEWKVAVVWECETHDEVALGKRLREVLDAPHRHAAARIPNSAGSR
jgi:DNA mismatch endonuclease (patch repair protein)